MGGSDKVSVTLERRQWDRLLYAIRICPTPYYGPYREETVKAAKSLIEQMGKGSTRADG